MTQIFDFLKQIRDQRDNPHLPMPNSWNLDLPLFKYQRVGASHLLGLRRFVLGDPTGSGKTPTALYSWGLYQDKYPSRLIVPTTKSAVTQWTEEVQKFLPGVRCFMANEDAQSRQEVYRDWIKAGPRSVLSLSWNILLRDQEFFMSPDPTWEDYTWIVADECQILKNPKSQLHGVMKSLCGKVPVVHGLTATLVKNKVHDAFNIFQLLMPGVMGPRFFERNYCIYGKRLVPTKTGIGGGRRLISVKHLEGYKNLDDFALRMSNLYLSRSDDEMDLERPQVRHLFRSVDLSPTHRKIYRDAEKGLFVTECENDLHAARYALAQAQIAANTPEFYCGQVTNFRFNQDLDLFHEDTFKHPEYSRIQKSNSKLDLLEDILNNDLEDEPVILYSSFATTIENLFLALHKYKPVKITGQTSQVQRDQARHAFQNGDTNLILITDAGGAALNLQRASQVILYSRPWDPGRYVQVIGRARRFGSTHKSIGVWHLTARDTVDELVDSVLASKLGGFEAIMKNITSLPDAGSSLPLEVARMMRQRRLKN